VRGFGVLDATVIAGLGLFGRHVEQAACLGHVVGARAAGEQAVVADDPSILKTERPPVTCARSKSYCGRQSPDRAASPSRGSGFVL